MGSSVACAPLLPRHFTVACSDIQQLEVNDFKRWPGADSRPPRAIQNPEIRIREERAISCMAMRVSLCLRNLSKSSLLESALRGIAPRGAYLLF